MIAVQSSSRLREWLHRYGPAEVISTIATLAAALVVQRTHGSDLNLALVSTWAGNLTYYGWVLSQDIRRTRHHLRARSMRYTLGGLAGNVRSLVIEFGPAEALDALLFRPTLMFWVPRWLHSVPRGVLIGKFAADLLFYVPTIFSYELSRRNRRRP